MFSDYNELLESLLSLSAEDEIVEFKEARRNFGMDELGEYFSSLSNEANLKGLDFAWLVFGVENSSHSIVGTQFALSKNKQNEVKKYIGEHTSPNMTFVDIIELEKDSKRVLLFQIPAAPRGMPVSFKRQFWGRDGESLVGLSIEKIERIRFALNRDWSAEVVPEAQLSDLDLDAIHMARKLFLERNSERRIEIESWDTMTFLNKAKLTQKGKITRTTLLLLGRNEVEYLLAPADPKIRWVLRDENGLVKSHYISGIPFILSVDAVYNKIRNLTYQHLQRGTLFPEEVLQYEPFTIREALYNCIAHQDYRMGMRIDVIEREDDLTFINGGTFIPGSVENVVIDNAPESFYRNQFLVTAMTNLKMVETAGGGIRKLFQIQRSKFFPLPDYDLSGNKVQVTITGKIVDEDFAALLSKNPDLSIEDVIALDKVSKKKKLTDQEIKRLKSRNLIEGRKPNYYLSKAVSDDLDKRPEYTKMKGFDNKYYRDLLLEALKEHGSLSKAEINRLLKNKLPESLSSEQARNRIDSILRGLRKANKIKNQINGNHSIWMLNDSINVENN